MYGIQYTQGFESPNLLHFGKKRLVLANLTLLRVTSEGV